MKDTTRDSTELEVTKMEVFLHFFSMTKHEQ